MPLITLNASANKKSLTFRLRRRNALSPEVAADEAREAHKLRAARRSGLKLHALLPELSLRDTAESSAARSQRRQSNLVTATAGNMGPVTYLTLGDAFTAINAGTHQGSITVDIQANSTETGPAILNSSGAGSASYTSVLIRPIIDAVTISGATATGRGLIELNGADNVTIDGDNPNAGGTNRDLTIQNTAANTITFTSVVRIALATTVVTSADNDTVKNCNIIGSSPGRNIATAISTDC